MPRHTDRRWFPALAAAALVLGTGCVPLPRYGYVGKAFVARKEGEKTLVADDGSTCRVKGDVFDKVQVGDNHTCAWRSPSDARPNADATPDPRPRRAPVLPSGAGR
ncbi:hypothetical protein tb265_31640 [Gemmatimonadetes bacterium T265]|nr:hypothetical protein tb265_31640 [Gemmatimonadetes bacterium T265]